MLPPYYFYWSRLDNKHMTKPWLDQALMNMAYRSAMEYFYTPFSGINSSLAPSWLTVLTLDKQDKEGFNIL